MNRAINKKIMAIVAIVALVAILGVCLVACNKDDYTKRLDKAGYEVQDMTKVAGDKVEWAITAEKKGSSLLSIDVVTVAKYKDTDDAKKAEEDAKKIYDTVKRSGKIVIAGTAQGVKDAQ